MSRDRDVVLSVQGLKKDFGKVHALKGIDLQLERPGVYGFLGPNGAGKTTTFKIISGLISASAGTVSICGSDIRTEKREALSNLGILFDSPAFYPYLTGKENLEVFAKWTGLDSGKEIDSLLDMVGLARALDRKTGEYSWGMKRRLGIASCLLGDPKLMILDEPTNGLDPAGIADIRRLLPQLAGDSDRVIMLSSHRMDEVDQICDHVTIINEGEIVASGDTEELSRPKAVVNIICGDSLKAASILGNIEGIESVDRTGRDRLSVLSPGMPAATINTLLVEAGIEVRQVMENRETLEEIFFRLTGEGKNEE
ncbi:MAG: ABC transporter ATP-binding protein [Candidatus Krumholzibacteria bacterium]|nr:ABC transporter ATP-binding protein [Candidatus Krumholzibacteria bacterium]